jgi:GcrA cell cycle regulator
MSNVWTPAMLATFRALHRGDGTFEAMAAQMSAIFQLEISRNALIGKARRMELPMRNEAGSRKPARRPKPVVIPRPVAASAPILPPPEPIAPDEEGLSIYQLTGTTCRWPLGKMEDRPPFRFCGEETPIEASYCDKHHELGHHRPRQP